MAIKDYETIEASTPSELDALVAKKLKDGWEPYGSPTHSDIMYRQAMVRNE